MIIIRPHNFILLDMDASNYISRILYKTLKTLQNFKICNIYFIIF